MRKRLSAALLAATLLSLPLLPTLIQGVAAQTTTPAPATTAKPKKAPSPGVAAMRERQKKCGAEWRAAKAAGKIEKGMTWPKYWSACNKRLKAAGG
jgi:hypothetical protein